MKIDNHLIISYQARFRSFWRDT